MNPQKFHNRVLLGIAGRLLASRHVPSIPASFSEILVVRQHDQLGDMMCVIPALRTLKQAYPAARITLVASPVNHDIMRGHPYLDRVVLYDKRVLSRSPAAVRKFHAQLTTRTYDLAVVPSTVSVSLTSALLARLSRAPVRLGPGSLEGVDNPAKFLFTHPVDLAWTDSPGRHQTLRNIDVLKPLGIPEGDISYILGLDAAEEAAAKSELGRFRAAHPLLIGIHPGAAKPGNTWPAESFSALAERLHADTGSGLVVTIGPRDAGVYDDLKSRLTVPHMFIRNAPLRHVAAVINELDFFISNDTGILHIAGALRPETLGLFGPTNPLHWAPAGRKNHYVASKDGSITSITVEEAYRAASIILLKVKS